MQGRVRVISGTGVLNANGGVSVSGSGANLMRTLNNTGVATYTGASVFYISSPGVWNNPIGSTLSLDGSGWIGNDGTINNAGTVRKTSGGTSDIHAVFNNTNLVDVQAGALRLIGGGTHTGRFQGTALHTVGPQFGSTNFQEGSEILCQDVRFDWNYGGDNHVRGTYNVPGSTTVGINTVFHPSADVQSVGALTVSGTCTFSSGETISPRA